MQRTRMVEGGWSECVESRPLSAEEASLLSKREGDVP